MNPNKYAYAGQPRSLEQSLRDEIADLRSRLEKAEKDAERIDWLEKQGEIGIGHIKFGDYRYYAGDPFDTVRSVIDAAIAQERT